MSPDENKAKSKLKNYAFTVVFILIVSIVFTAILAAANAAAMPMIEENALLAERRAILDVFALDTSGPAPEVFSRFDQSIRTVEAGDLTLYAQVDPGGKVQGYAVPFAGPGLWGTIEGYLGISPDRTKILGLVFTQQNETPGLGGRIEEPIFLDQFRGVPIQPGTELAFGASASQDIDAVTGATATSNAVLKILNQLLDETVSQLEVMPGE